MGKGIKLSPKYGLNPSLLKCIICHEDTGEIGLFGKVNERKPDGRPDFRTDVQMPMYARAGLCDRCKKLLAEGNVGFLADNGDTAMIKGEAVKKMVGKERYQEVAGKVVRVHESFWKD